MVEFEIKYITPDVKLSEFKGDRYKAEFAFPYHILVWLISGEAKIIQGDTAYLYAAGDIFLIPRNQIATVLILPKDGQNHRSVSMHLTSERLKDFYDGIQPGAASQLPQKMLSFGRHPLLESCLASLIPYFDVQGPFPENIASLKITEAISILRLVTPNIDSILANFEEPGKIPLIEFMEKNFMYNLPLEKFGYLTGRSLSTFNRDFRKAFHTTPQKWLLQKRLELAHYQLKESNKRPVEVYLEVGFEDLSHFSFAFKKHFGYPPADLVKKP
ncbi:MAG TPA: AraC family transcriptional regulator [Puia sp.]